MTEMTAKETPKSSPAETAPKKSRRKSFVALLLSVPLILVAGAGVWWYAGGATQSTENAALHLGRVSVASVVGGRVVHVRVRELQHVAKGDVLFQVDPQPYQIALDRAEAALQSARLQVDQMKAAYAEARAAADLARSDADFLRSELARQESLTGRGVETQSKLRDARHASTQAEARAAVAESTVAATLAALGNDPAAETDAHPMVRAALAAVAAARYDLSATRVLAPADGVISQSATFGEGSMVSPGQPVFALVETGNIWVEANFKETQLANIRSGQPVEVVLDISPDRPFAGEVEGIGAGTGAEFALLPAQNATGNWVKVTQRVPVRIRLERPEDLAGYASGLSAEVTVDTGNGTGLLTAQAGQ